MLLNFVLTMISVAIPAYIVASVIHGYMMSTGTFVQRVQAAFMRSVTVTWTRLNVLSAGVIYAVADIATLAGAPGVKDAITPYMKPQYMAAYALIVAFGAEIARRRSLK